jgi:GNAT superfamily N-acetyltransferase
MTEVLQDLSARAIACAIEENFWEVMVLFHRFSQTELFVGPDIHWVITGIAHPFFNVVGHADLAPDAVDSEIEAAIGRGRSRNAPISWRTGPTTKPTDLGAHLERHGFTLGWDEPGMAADLLKLNESLPKPTGLVIEQVGDADTLEQFCHTGVVGFGLPDSIEGTFQELWANVGVGPEVPLRHYLGWLDGKPVATSSLILGAGVAGIYTVTTVADARRKGIGAAMTLVACRDAREFGYRVAVLGASEMGYGVYQKIGFREYCKASFYVLKSGTEQDE